MIRVNIANFDFNYLCFDTVNPFLIMYTRIDRVPVNMPLKFAKILTKIVSQVNYLKSRKLQLLLFFPLQCFIRQTDNFGLTPFCYCDAEFLTRVARSSLYITSPD